ncbi:hypothetical protein CYG49_04470 [Candidatus Saccharibacteria bacterium]|nr:MAG: hypothetical protein CYG49_04470 [Candidatus Saccharibacteria bacterium]
MAKVAPVVVRFFSKPVSVYTRLERKIGPGIALLLLVAVLFIAWLAVTVTVRVVVNEVAERTFLKNFYTKAAITETYSREIRLPNLIRQEETGMNRSDSWSRRGRAGILDDCKYGTYSEGGQTKQHARWCKKGYSQYFGFEQLDERSIDDIEKYMTSIGWISREDQESRKWIKEYVLEDGQTNRGYSFYRKDGTEASVMFLNKNSDLVRSSSCQSYSYCRFLESDDSRFKYFYFVNIYYEEKPHIK